MSALVKITRALLHVALNDLERPHPFAAERLGFFSFRQSGHPKNPQILCYDYHPIPDDHYVRDRTVGGRIGGAAIQAAMLRGYREKAGQLWVHMHGRVGNPGASGTDRREGPRVVQSCANLYPDSMHGWAVISEDGITGEAKDRDGILVSLDRLAVVGWPMIVPPRPAVEPKLWRRRATDFDADRQSFLGPDAQPTIERSKLGIVGLGGGGSHINQQAAHIGFLRGVLCDAQRIEKTNLNRLVGATRQDVRGKRFKAEIAARVWRGIQPHAELDDRPLSWEDKREELRDCDIIFGAIDGFAARRDLEAFCRSHCIPFIDIGMLVLRPERRPPEIRGQAILSMPGELCMHCLQFLTGRNLAEEVQRYDKSPQPQVVWPNGTLASSAIGYALGMLTAWSGENRPVCRIDYRGSALGLTPAPIAEMLRGKVCPHYPLSQAGDPIFRSL